MFQYSPNFRQVVFWEPQVSPSGADGTESNPDSGLATWAPQETQIAIFQLLSGDTDLTALLGATGKIFDYLPDNTDFPYVTMNIKPWLDRGNYTHEGLSCVLQIDVWYQPGKSPYTGRGDKRVQLIQKRIDELLHKQNLDVDGWNTLILRRALIDIITDPDTVTRHGIQQFKLFLGR